MDKICQDVFNDISKYLSLIDIAKLKKTNKLLRKYTNDYQYIYLTKQLKISNSNINIVENKQRFYEYIRHLIYMFYINNNFLYTQTYDKHDLDNIEIIHYFKNKYLNDIILDIFFHYIKTKSVMNYPDILNLILITNFTYITYYKHNISIESGFELFKNFNNKNTYVSKFQDTMIDYYIYILDSIHNNQYVFNTFEKIYEISPYVINIPGLKKIFTYRILNLSKTKILFCCNLDNCVVSNLNQICDSKNTYYNDNLISHNYSELKTFLYNECIEYYNILINRENYLLNKKIFIKNPITNRRMRVNGKKWVTLICFLKKNNRDIYNIIITDVLKQQDYLRNKIFGKNN